MVKLTFLITLAATVLASQVMAQDAGSSASVQSTASSSPTSSSPTATPTQVALPSDQAAANLSSLRSSIMSKLNITATGGGLSSTASGGAAAASTTGSKSDAIAYKPVGTVLAVTSVVLVGLFF